MNIGELQQLALKHGFPDPNLAAAVAMAESGGNATAVGDVQYGGSIGLWQINLPAHPEYDSKSLEDPDYNANAAFAISKGGTNWQPWTTYRTGAYKPYYAPPTASVWQDFAAVALVGGIMALGVVKAVSIEYTAKRVWGWLWA